MKKGRLNGGAPDRVRTYDRPLRRRMLYPTELRAHGWTDPQILTRSDLLGNRVSLRFASETGIFRRISVRAEVAPTSFLSLASQQQ